MLKSAQLLRCSFKGQEVASLVNSSAVFLPFLCSHERFIEFEIPLDIKIHCLIVLQYP